MITQRPYRDLADLQAMYAVLSAGAAADTGAFYVHPGDLRPDYVGLHARSEAENAGNIAFYNACGFEVEAHLLAYEKHLENSPRRRHLRWLVE